MPRLRPYLCQPGLCDACDTLSPADDILWPVFDIPVVPRRYRCSEPTASFVAGWRPAVLRRVKAYRQRVKFPPGRPAAPLVWLDAIAPYWSIRAAAAFEARNGTGVTWRSDIFPTQSPCTRCAAS